MSAVLYRIRITSRRHAAQTIVATVVVALVGAIVLTVAAGARRTATAPDRLTAHSDLAFDALVTQDQGGRPRTSEIAGLPSVASAASVTFVFGGLMGPDGTDLSDSLVFTGDPKPVGGSIVSGRAADPDDAHEMVVSQAFVDRFGAAIGDIDDLVTLTQDQADTTGFTVDPDFGSPRHVTIVGVVDGPGRLDDNTPLAVISPALLGDPDLGVALTLTDVDLKAPAGLQTLRADLDTLHDGADLRLDPVSW